MNKSSNGFDARRQNKYSIRRFTVGTASIIVGATLLFGLGQEARAAETAANDSSQSTGSTSEQPNTPTDQPAPDAQTSQTETQTNTADQTKTQSAETTKEAAPTTAPETAEQPAPTQDTAQPEAQQTETTAAKETATETANQPAQEQASATQEAPAEQPAPTKEETTVKTEDTAVQAPKSQETAQKETSTANETVAPKQNNTTAPVENTVTETAPKQESAPEQNVTSAPQADTVENTTLTAAPQQLTAAEPTNAEVTGTNNDAATQQLAEQAGVTPQDSPEVAAAKLLQQSSQNKDANTIETVAETTPMLRSASAFTAGAPNDTLVTQTGANVNDLVTVSNAQITETAIDPNQGGNFALTGDYTVNGTVKQGDYFTFQFPDNVNLDGALDYTGNDNKMVFSLDSPAGFTIADGSYDTNTKTLTYTFTDWVNGKDNIAGSFNIAQFPDRQDAQSVGTYPLNYDLAGETYSPEITYNYSPVDEGFESASLSSSISDVDNTNTTNTFKQTIYVNPQDKTLNDAFVTLAPKEGSSAIINTTDSKFQIYKVDDPNTLTDSYYFDTTGKQDLAADFQNAGKIHTNQDGLVQIDFGAIDSPYVIIMETPFDTTIGNEITTRDTIYTTDTNNIKNSYYWDNGVIVSDSSGTGDGTEQTYRLGDYVWEDTNKDGIQDAGESALQGVNVTLKDESGNVLQNAVTDQYGNYLFTDLTNGNYVVEFATPEGYEPTVQGDGTNADVDSNGLVAKATIQGGDNLTIDSGFYKPTPVPATYNLGDYVWEDSNKDGIQNSNEVGIANVTVTLTKPDGTTETATTDAQGKYNFTGLENGDYTVEFTAPEGYEATLTNVGDQALDSNGLKTTATINNADNKTIDSGFYKPAVEPTPVPATYNLGDYVWEDSNKDGIQNSNEVGIANVTVTLTKPDGTTETATTDAQGKYNFTGLENGDYTVE
uniref:SdrD B-like domain-containing protein n=1 Tax=Staphylococcus simulans TaxID=1286 RepID=UPI000D0269E0